jgi:hypothetical protein
VPSAPTATTRPVEQRLSVPTAPLDPPGFAAPTNPGPPAPGGDDFLIPAPPKNN